MILASSFDVRSVKSRQSQPSVVSKREKEDKILNTVKSAARQGLTVAEQRFKSIDISVPVTSAVKLANIYEPLDPYLLRELPPVINSSDFISWRLEDTATRDQAQTDFLEVVLKKETHDYRSPLYVDILDSYFLAKPRGVRKLCQ